MWGSVQGSNWKLSKGECWASSTTFGVGIQVSGLEPNPSQVNLPAAAPEGLLFLLYYSQAKS